MAPVFRALKSEFFRDWSENMAYVLGYFAADGTMVRNKRGAHFIEFHSTDRALIRTVRNALESAHRISIRHGKSATHKTAYRLQIGSKQMFQDLKRHGFHQNKSNTIRFPSIPREYVGHFVRGYFDGDGNVYFKRHWAQARQKMIWVFSSRFTCGSEKYLTALHAVLRKHGIEKGAVKQKSNRRGYELVLSHRDSLALYRLMYDTSRDTGLYLPRKYKVFQKVIRTLYPAMRAYGVPYSRSARKK